MAKPGDKPEEKEPDEVQETDAGDETDESGQDADKSTEPDDADKGREALRKKNAENLSLRRRLRETEKKLADSSKPADGEEVDVDKIREQAKTEAAAEALRERVMDKIEAKARKFADSEDAAAILLRTHQVDDFIDDGKIDVSAIAEALDELADSKPHLVAKQTTAGEFDSGRGKGRYKGQLDKGDLANMTPEQINAARKDGRLDRLMGKPA